ncbi:MAG: hypothetical protein HKN43_08860 [Rhodothermales bacterium]|nr:hypothetical protein [Rhodothermales bacterium]
MTIMPLFCNNLARKDVLIGIMFVMGVNQSNCTDMLNTAREELARQVGLFSEKYAARRKAVRDTLRNGVYKPAGRGKPASEYLLRMISEGEAVPVINPVVDIFNYLSARYQIPISVWDTEVNANAGVSFELGQSEDSYAFNTAGHEIALHDLIIGCVTGSEDRTPIVSPVKDAHSVKVGDKTDNVAAAFYLPESERAAFAEMEASAKKMLQLSAPGSHIESALLASGEEKRFKAFVDHRDG